MNKLDLDIIRLQAQAYQLLEDSFMSIKEVEEHTEALANIVALALNIITRQEQLTEDQAMALLILIIVKATEIYNE
jgi:hypothetical protein